jgi:polar amino acid transport system permease protein
MQSKLIAAATFKSSTVFTLVALMYLAMSLPMMFAIGRLEKRMGTKK